MMKKRPDSRPLVVRLTMGAAALVVLVAILLGAQLALGNFHAVVPGEFYRAAQPDAADLAYYQQHYGIKSVINLRGGNADNTWYQQELETSRALGLTHLDFRMKAARELTPERTEALIELMKSAPKPVLIHCRSGADRTGFASAVYLWAVKGVPLESATWQLSLRYGHLPFGWTNAQAMDRTLSAMGKAAPAP